MDGATAIVHAAPALGAAFTQYTAEFEPGGSLGPARRTALRLRARRRDRRGRRTRSIDSLPATTPICPMATPPYASAAGQRAPL